MCFFSMGGDGRYCGCKVDVYFGCCLIGLVVVGCGDNYFWCFFRFVVFFWFGVKLSFC